MKYKALVLDHDDTVVRSTPEIHYPAFLAAMRVLRPERANTSLREFIRFSLAPGIYPFFTQVLRFNEEELALEQKIWREYTVTTVADAYEGFDALFAAYRAAGGKICVASHSEAMNIKRDYRTLFGFEPDLVFGWERPEPERKPHPFPLDETMKVLGLTSKELLMVDDLMPGYDMAAARNVDFAYAGWSDTAFAAGAEVRPVAKYAFDRVAALNDFLMGS